jgi:hypothetical protein
MRHILAPPPIPGLASSVAETAAPAPLIAPAGGVEGGAAAPVGTAPRAVAIATIAAAAEKEDLAAVDVGADHEPERVHRSSRTPCKGMDTREEMCESWSLGQAESRPRGLARGSGGVEPSGPSPSRRPGGNGLPYGGRLRQPSCPRRSLSRIPPFLLINDSWSPRSSAAVWRQARRRRREPVSS